MLGVVGKLVKYVVQLSKKLIIKKNMILFSHGVQRANDYVLVSRNFRD
jgi:hypothetical protein